MDLLTAVFLLLGVILGISWLFREILAIHRHNLCSLDGPKGYPVFGSIFPLLKNWKSPLKQYSKWAEEFGGIYKVKIGSQLAVVVNDAENFIKVFGKTGNKLNYRPRGNVLSLAMGNKGIATSDGKVWLEHRLFAAKAFRELNIGRSSTDLTIQKEVEKLVEHIKKECGTRAGIYEDVEDDLSVSIFNILWQFVVSSEDDSKFNANGSTKSCINVKKMLLGSRTQLLAAEQSGGHNFYFILQILWIFLANPLKLLPSYIKRVLFVKQELKREKAKIENESPNENRNKSLVQLYLQEIQGDYCGELNEDQLEVFMSDFIVAGVESLSSSIRWTLLYLAINPEIMSKLRAELDKLESTTLMESLRSKEDLPFLKCTISESLRIRPPIHAIVHVNKKDLFLEDSFIPKDTIFIGNIWEIHRNKQVWKNPQQFNPPRFLDADGRIIKKRVDKCFAFSTGPRRCLGEQLSRMELSAFVATLVTKFDISINPKKLHKFTMEPLVTLSLIPKDNFLVFKPREL